MRRGRAEGCCRPARRRRAATRPRSRRRPASARRRGRAPRSARAGGARAGRAGPAAGGCSRAGRRRPRTPRPGAAGCLGGRGSGGRPPSPPGAPRAARRARSGRCGSARCAASPRRRPAISVTRRSIAVWMSSSLGTNVNAPSFSSRAGLVERVRDREPLLLGQQPHRREHVDVRARPREVVVREPLVERQADAQRHQRVGRTFGEAPVPERLALFGAHRPGPSASPRTAGSSLRWRFDQVSTERPHSRTNPAASSCRNASSAS